MTVAVNGSGPRIRDAEGGEGPANRDEAVFQPSNYNNDVPLGDALMIRTLAAFLAAVLFSTLAFASDFDSVKLQNWHQWRGPLATGAAPHGNPPTKWDSQTNIKWKVEIPGSGSASPIVWQDKIFLLTAVEAPE
jgi:hypothetical protein